MSELKIVSILLGVIFAVSGVAALIRPQAACDLLKAFPRSKSAGWILAAICIAWSGWLVYEMPLGGFERYKNLVYILIPVSFFVIITYMGELLAARALGGILMLAPHPMLIAAQFHPSALRYVVIIMAYVMVIKGMALTLSPYLFRRYAKSIYNNGKLFRIICGSWAAWGVLLFGLGIFAF